MTVTEFRKKRSHDYLGTFSFIDYIDNFVCNIGVGRNPR